MVRDSRAFVACLVAALAFGCEGEKETTPADTTDATVADVAADVAASDLGVDTSGEVNEPPVPNESPSCNPIAADWDCMLPYPSDVFLIRDEALPTGRRVALGTDALVVSTTTGERVDPTQWHPLDGYSLNPQIMALFPTGVDPSNLIRHYDQPTRSLEPATATTVLLEAKTGTPVLHFSEVAPEPGPPERRPVMIRPMVRLDERTRFIVAIRDLEDLDGAAIEPPEPFRSIRDGVSLDDPELTALAERYEAHIFPVLEAAGVERATLQLAWDFTTGSEANLIDDMLAVRADAIARFEQSPPTVEVLNIEEDVKERLSRTGALRLRVRHETTCMRDPRGSCWAA